MPLFDTFTQLGLAVMPHLALAYFVLITAISLIAVCARSKERRGDALAVLRTLLLRNKRKGRR